ncbi:hypothetical protein CKO51_01850 [Rhodopirellula sp. SM50]|nr:hypothetical protein [Rhodopirellula sp. SM50]PAY21347.1 hypothetical protein CKO51_01850 [Rhodopirellula sp. SM50]
MSSQRSIPPIAADELRRLVLCTLSRDGITMRSYFDGFSQSALDQHLSGMLGLMSLDRFKAPATLIAVEHFVSFLSEIGLVKPKSQTRSKKVLPNLRSRLQRAFGDEWLRFLSWTR